MKTDALWAPWRITYLKTFRGGQRRKGCLFCRAARSRRDRANYVFLRSPHMIGILNIFPYANGHVMIAPRRHAARLEQLNDEEICDMMVQVRATTRRLDKVLGPDGYNIGINIGRAAGAGIDRHLHVHIVPRWAGDTNFMTVAAGTRVIGQSLEAFYRLLCPAKKRR
jgi:ATP adenylyltransferase